MARAETCVVCGEVIPEGRQVCPSCGAGHKPERRCWLCGKNGSADPLDRHHIFGAANRSKSEKYGLVVLLCHRECHIFGKNSVHQSADTMKMLRQFGQKKAMEENGWSTEDFIREFGKNYLED